MTDREALLRAICDNHDEDTPRLAFADLLEEEGEPERARFIRVQCGLRMPQIHAPNCDVPWSCNHRPDYNPGREAGGPQWVWSRGFLSFVLWDTASWLRNGPAVVRAHPTVREVRLSDREPEPNPYGGDRHTWTFGDLPVRPSDVPYSLIRVMTEHLGEEGRL
jgi:uncharacterized protein (TIGR02996 family)